MSHLSHNPREEVFEFKRGQGKRIPCDDDDGLDELIEAAVQQKEHDEQFTKIEGEQK